MSRWMRWFRGELMGFALLLSSVPLCWAAFAWRRLLFRTTFVAITGSLGKTTTKDCLASILRTAGPVFASRGTQNAQPLISLNLLRVRPWHRWAILELGSAGPGQLLPIARLVKPQVGVLLGIAPTHTKSYGSLEEIAREKCSLLDAVQPGGTVILNGDDPLLAAQMPPRPLQVRRFGLAPGCELWADQIESNWPGRLNLLVHRGEETVRVHSQLVGTQWTPSILAALLAGVHCGVDLLASAAALELMPPSKARMQPVLSPSGAIFLRDEYNASPKSFEAAFELMRNAAASRRVLVLSDISDTKWQSRRVRKLGVTAAGCSDLVVFVGERAFTGRQGALSAGMPESMVCAFGQPEDAARFLRTSLRKGDLVLLKGWQSHHLERLLLAQVGEVGCWIPSCTKRILCDSCWRAGLSRKQLNRLTVPSAPAGVSECATRILPNPLPKKETTCSGT